MQIQKTLTQKMPVLGSSVDSEKIALTVKGILIGIIPLIIWIGGYFGINIDITDLNTLTDSFINILVIVWTTISAVMTFFGLIRKILNKYFG